MKSRVKSSLDRWWRVEKISRRLWLRGEGWLLGGLSLMWLAARFFPFREYGTMCAVRRATGLPCLTCGFTRSFASLVHGDGARVWRECPGAIPFFLCGAALTLVLVVGLAFGYRIAPGPRWNGRGRPWMWVIVAAVIVLFANWIYRLRSGYA